MKEQIKTLLIPITWLPIITHGYACGYVGVPKGHPWYGQDYYSVDVSIHGGLTYSGKNPSSKIDDLWWLGFDTAHFGDTMQNCSKAYCENEVASLLKQAEEAITHDKQAVS